MSAPCHQVAITRDWVCGARGAGESDEDALDAVLLSLGLEESDEEQAAQGVFSEEPSSMLHVLVQAFQAGCLRAKACDDAKDAPYRSVAIASCCYHHPILRLVAIIIHCVLLLPSSYPCAAPSSTLLQRHSVRIPINNICIFRAVIPRRLPLPFADDDQRKSL